MLVVMQSQATPEEVARGAEEIRRMSLAPHPPHPGDTTVRTPMAEVGAGAFTSNAGPCSVEDEATMLRTAEFLANRGVRLNMAPAAGAGGLLAEVHPDPDPDHASSDGAQSQDLDAFERLLESLRRLAEPLGRPIR